MALPNGIKTTTVTFGTAVTMISKKNLTMSVTFTPTTSLVWAATGTVLIADAEGFTADPGAQGSVTLINPDQPGFTDGNGNTTRNWGYKVEATYADGATVLFTAPAKYITWTAADSGPLDLDQMIPVAASSGITVSMPLVTSVNGRTGDVTITGGGESGGASDAHVIDLCAAPYNVAPGDDISTELQAAYTGLAASGQSGKILLSKVGTYRLDGPLQTGSYTGSAGTGDRQGGGLTHTWNAQIVIPAVPYDGVAAPAITLEGAVDPSVGWGFTGDAQGVTIVSTITSGKMIEAASGYDGWGKTWTGIMPIFRNVIFRLPDNPTAGAIDIQHTLRTRIERVAVLTQNSWVVPTGNVSTAVGIALPSYYENGDVTVRDVNVRGFPAAFRISEHAVFDNIQIVGCQTAFICHDGGHTNYLGNVDIEDTAAVFYLEPGIRIALAVYGYVDQEQNGLWPTMALVADPSDSGLIIGSIDLAVGIPGSLGIVKPAAGANNTIGLLQVRNINFGHVAGWGAEHPVDTFARSSGYGLTGLTGGAPGYSWPTLHPWRANGDFTLAPSNPAGSGHSTMRMTAGYSAEALLPVKNAALGGTQRSIEATFTPAATGTMSFGILASRLFNDNQSIYASVFNGTLNLGFGNYQSQSVPLSAPGVVTAGQQVKLRLELYYQGNVPTVAKAYANGNLQLTRTISASEAATLGGSLYQPFLEDGVHFHDNDNVSTVSSFIVRDLATPLPAPTPGEYLSVQVGFPNGSATAFTGSQGFSIVPLDTVNYDTAGRFDTSSHVYTIPETGYWQINAAVRPVDGYQYVQIGIGVDTSNRDSATFAWLETNANRTTLLYSRVNHFTAGDQVRLFTYADAAGTTNFNTGALSLTLLGT